MADSSRLKKMLLAATNLMHGSSCGNKAIFILQLMGIDASTIFTQHLTNSPAYGEYSAVGQLTAEDIDKIYQTLKRNNLVNFAYVMTGYIGKQTDIFEKWADIIEDLKIQNPETIYVCDPVLGDNGTLWVPSETVVVFKKKLVPLARIVLPNDFELEQLTDITIKTEADALKGCDILHNMGVEIVFLTGMTSQEDGKYISIISRDRGGRKETYKTEFPKIPEFFIGPGDILAALFVGWFSKDNVSLKEAFEKSLSSMQSFMKRTYQNALDCERKKREKVLILPRCRTIAYKQNDATDQIKLPEIMEHLKEAFEKSLSSMQSFMKRTYQNALDNTEPGEQINPSLLELQIINNKNVIEKPDGNLVAVKVR